jgi:hypothetical protein
MPAEIKSCRAGANRDGASDRADRVTRAETEGPKFIRSAPSAPRSSPVAYTRVGDLGSATLLPPAHGLQGLSGRREPASRDPSGVDSLSRQRRLRYCRVDKSRFPLQDVFDPYRPELHYMRGPGRQMVGEARQHRPQQASSRNSCRTKNPAPLGFEERE